MLVLLGLAFSCKKTGDPVSNTEVTPPVEQIIVSKNITSGSFTEVSNTTIGLSATTVKIAKPGTPVDGIEIAIPTNSYTSNPALKISYAEIKSHQFGANFNPISPIISISCDGGYSATPMQVTIPIKLPEGHFAMGYFLDETTGKLEGLPVLKLSPTSITVCTRHFMSAARLKAADANQKEAKAGLTAFANMIISSISESTLKSQTIINSGFAIGSDDWEFVNNGSYLSSGGHCAGQSITSMWYYYEKKLNGEANLFHRFDLLNQKSNPNFMWQDNPMGYRFASTIQEDFDFSGWITKLTLEAYLPGLVFKSFATAILVTGEPQFVLINNSAGKGGHAMIVSKVNFNEGKLYVADPNYPNNYTTAGVESIRTIDYVGGILKPYETGLVAGGNSITMDQIGYFGKTAFIEWTKIGKRYNELVNNTIGTVAPNIFPSYTMWVKDKTKDFELKDGITVSKDTLSTYVECPTATERVTINGKRIISSEVYGTDGLIKSKQNIPGVTNWSLSIGQYVILKPGLNKLGYYIVGWNSNVLYDKSTERIPLFVDFKWINVQYTKLEISPNPIIGEPDKDIIITAKSYGSATKNGKYIWNFGDGTADVAVTNDSIVKYKYSKAGIYNVVLNLYDNATNKLVSTSVATAKINQAIVKLDISPNPIVVAFGKEITITAKSYGSGPKNAKYVWNFGDGTADVTRTNDSIVKYKYPKAGDYNVVLNLYDNTTNKLVGTSTAKANINLLITKFSLFFALEFYCDVTYPDGRKLLNQKRYANLDIREIPCVQIGNTINASWDGNYVGYYHKGTAKFTLSGTNTVSFTVSDTYTNPGIYLTTWNATSKEIPFISDNDAYHWLNYGAPVSFNVLQTANYINDYINPNSKSISESKSLFYDPNSNLATLLTIKLYY